MAEYPDVVTDAGGQVWSVSATGQLTPVPIVKQPYPKWITDKDGVHRIVQTAQEHAEAGEPPDPRHHDAPPPPPVKPAPHKAHKGH